MSIRRFQQRPTVFLSFCLAGAATGAGVSTTLEALWRVELVTLALNFTDVPEAKDETGKALCAGAARVTVGANGQASKETITAKQAALFTDWVLMRFLV